MPLRVSSGNGPKSTSSTFREWLSSGSKEAGTTSVSGSTKRYSLTHSKPRVLMIILNSQTETSPTRQCGALVNDYTLVNEALSLTACHSPSHHAAPPYLLFVYVSSFSKGNTGSKGKDKDPHHPGRLCVRWCCLYVEYVFLSHTNALLVSSSVSLLTLAPPPIACAL